MSTLFLSLLLAVSPAFSDEPENIFREQARTRHSVKKWISRFTSVEAESFIELLNRGEPLRPMIERILERHGVPREFYFLPLVESGYKLHIVSRKRAVGLWQLVTSTGALYGLSTGKKKDERRDARLSTQAAAKYLRDLYDRFGSWDVVVAAYNAGESRVRKVLRRTRDGDLWRAIETRALPAETRRLVPKFIAAAVLGGDPERYGINAERLTDPLALN